MEHDAALNNTAATAAAAIGAGRGIGENGSDNACEGGDGKSLAVKKGDVIEMADEKEIVLAVSVSAKLAKLAAKNGKGSIQIMVLIVFSCIAAAGGDGGCGCGGCRVALLLLCGGFISGRPEVSHWRLSLSLRTTATRRTI